MAAAASNTMTLKHEGLCLLMREEKCLQKSASRLFLTSLAQTLGIMLTPTDQGEWDCHSQLCFIMDKTGALNGGEDGKRLRAVNLLTAMRAFL